MNKMFVMSIYYLFIFLLLWAAPLSAKNITSNNMSPYVRMHVSDAVKWQRWDEDVILRAQKEKKLILISSGYFSCHWCHVMQRESFNDKSVAEILNRYFIPVKVDRELEPVLDSYLIEFMKKTQGYAGWPLNVFLTPSGYPLTGLVYQTKPKFLDTLVLLKEKWSSQSVRLEKISLDVFNHLSQMERKASNVTAKDLLKIILNDVRESMDEFEGGFGNQSKFPRPHLMMALLDIYVKKPEPWLKDFIQLTLKQMAERGLHDSVFGGFFRYTVDQSWNVPHFEKMLYVNASMLSLYVKAYEVFNNNKWLMLAKETMDFIVADMTDGKDGYVSALTAQSQRGGEGAAYIWRDGELTGELNQKQYEWFVKNSIEITIENTNYRFAIGNWSTRFGKEMQSLLRAKKQQVRHLKDKKFIISWNAYLLSAMLELNTVLQNEEYDEIVSRLYSRLKNEFFNTNQVKQLSGDSELLSDYVFMANAINMWQKYKHSNKDKRLLKQLIMDILEKFRMEGGWRLTGKGIIPLPENIVSIADGNLPSTDAVFLKLLMLLPDEQMQGLAVTRENMYPVSRRVEEQSMEYATHIAVRLELESPKAQGW